jgi:hypothetical protein
MSGGPERREPSPRLSSLKTSNPRSNTASPTRKPPGSPRWPGSIMDGAGTSTRVSPRRRGRVRLTSDLAMTSSPDTLLRRVKQLKGGSPSPPRFVGIDDWAWRKGQHYGSIVVDLERGEIIDLLSDRDAETVKKWLTEHPGIELVSRDRWSDYAKAAAEAAPEAQQIADRWHLLKNLREAIERLFERESETIAQALKPAEPAPESVGVASEAPTREEQRTEETPSPPQPGDPAAATSRTEAQPAKRQRRIERFERVHELHHLGCTRGTRTTNWWPSPRGGCYWSRCRPTPQS